MTDKEFRDQFLWAVRHYGSDDTSGILQHLREVLFDSGNCRDDKPKKRPVKCGSYYFEFGERKKCVK
ncbi:MAG: hypothetical protein DRN81_03105 [Thermoproteota archaeon]|nr:MAG: hypothetical protein DRN81_03105 [Candidatus Korarchaeota archaeon]